MIVDLQNNEEREAKFNHVGLWIQGNPVSPYQYRKQLKQ